MATRTRRPAAKRKTDSKPARTAPRTAVQEALQVTWQLKGNLKNAQLAYLRVGKLLAQVRDKQLYVALGHADLEGYAAQRLNLGRTSLYKYLRVYDWAGRFHPEWLKPKPKGFIPDLSDAANLIWIENELARKDIEPAHRAALAELRQKALDGALQQKDINEFRKRGSQPVDTSLKAFLAKLRSLCRAGAKLANLPPEVLPLLDSAVEILKNDHALQVAGLADLGRWTGFGDKISTA